MASCCCREQYLRGVIQTQDLDAHTQGALMYSSPQSAVYFFQCMCMLT